MGLQSRKMVTAGTWRRQCCLTLVTASSCYLVAMVLLAGAATADCSKQPQTASAGNPSGRMEWVAVSGDGKSFVLPDSKRPFVPWGFNYDHDERGRLLEDYWQAEWEKVVQDFRRMKQMGANVVRIHLQTARFMRSAEQADQAALRQLARLVGLAEQCRLYLDLTGLGCYHKKDVPAWYDQMDEGQRWAVQCRFWEAVAKCCADSPAVFCYDLMNEPVVPGGRRKPGDWLGPDFAGKHFVQFITLDQADRPRHQIAQRWTATLATAIRRHDQRHMITVGLVDWSLERPGLTSGFVPEKIAPELDFLSVHIYPENGKIDQALETLSGFCVGKPVLIEETFPLRCTQQEFETFIDRSQQKAAGWLGFYWGNPPEQLRNSNSIADAITLQWLEFFQRRAKSMGNY